VAVGWVVLVAATPRRTRDVSINDPINSHTRLPSLSVVVVVVTMGEAGVKSKKYVGDCVKPEEEEEEEEEEELVVGRPAMLFFLKETTD